MPYHCTPFPIKWRQSACGESVTQKGLNDKSPFQFVFIYKTHLKVNMDGSS